MKSFGLLRTNVGLTTNVKVVVDSQYGLSLDSIDSTMELSSTKYKKMSFNKDNYYDELVPNFWNNLPAELAYYIKYDEDSDSMTDNFSSQYDEIYQYGARNITNNKNYSEEYEYFAPLYLINNKLPKKFVIMRVDGSGMIGLNRFNIKSEIFRKFKTVKVFDLTTKSALGEWMEKSFVKNDFFPQNPFNMSFTRLEFSNWNGIDYTTGGYISKSLFLEDVVEEEKEIFEMEKFIFDGYKKNKVIFPNILNFSFLFDDTPANSIALRKWSINRYYGFYLDDMELVSTLSPYITPFIKTDAVIKENNILFSETGDPFVEGWSEERPLYVEYNGEYYKVEKFTETVGKATTPTNINKGTKNSTYGSVSAQLEDVSTSMKTNIVSDEVTDTIVTRWRIISNIDLSGKESLINKNTGYINSENVLIKYDQSNFAIDNFELSDVWVIEIDGMHHNLVKENDTIKVYTDYSFKFYENYYDYWIYEADASYRKSVSFVVDQNNPPKKFSIYRLKFSDIKDFDDRIVDTEYSKFEYEKNDDLTDTDETKLYFTNLNSNVYPKELDDFKFKNKISNIPVSSEYTANNETFKIIGDELSQIWRKNPVYCRWAFENSISANDYPYPLNNSLKFEDHNRTANTLNPNPSRRDRNLDHFYTINSSTFSYLHHTLHVENNTEYGIDVNFEFDMNKYLGIDTFTNGVTSTTYSVDYFKYFFERKASFLSNTIKKNTKKYSLFTEGDDNTPNSSLFRGIKFSIYDADIIKNSSEQIEKINLKTSNGFDDYKLSVLLTEKDNGMVWQVIEKWEMDKNYKKNAIVVYDDILYIAKNDSTTTTPVFYLSYPNDSQKDVKSAPYLQSSDINIVGLTIRGENYNPISYDWQTYTNEYSIFWNPKKDYALNDIVYNAGDYYICGDITSTLDFWNPVRAYSDIIYTEGSTVIFNGEYYRSIATKNIYPPDNSKYWTKTTTSILPKWSRIKIWSPGISYAANSHVIQKNTVYYNNSTTAIAAGNEPGAQNSPWTRKYGIEQDTDFVYLPNSNPLIKMNNQIYLIKSNPNNSTLENGINIYINKKWKNILINIAINDNTVENISNSDRDSIYKSSNSKLTAKNLIDAINDISNKYDFSDYINYVVIDESGFKTYNYAGIGDSRIENLKHILFAERPEQISIKANSLDSKPVNVDILKPVKYLNDGLISHIEELNYFNYTHLATEIEANNETPLVTSNYHGQTNITENTLYRFGGSYIPLFYDIDLFKGDNSTPYGEIKIILEISEQQTVYFNYERNGAKIEKAHTISPGLSYSSSANPISDYYGQIIGIINEEDLIKDIDMKFDILKTNKFDYPTETMLLHLDADLYNKTITWGDLGPYSNNIDLSLIIASHKYTNLYPGSYFSTNKNIGIKTDRIVEFGENTTWEAWVRCESGFNQNSVFMGESSVINFGFYWNYLTDTLGIIFRNRIGDVAKEFQSEAVLKPKTWYHVVFTTQYDGANTICKIYVDGELQKRLNSEETSTVFSGKQTPSEQAFSIGGYTGMPWPVNTNTPTNTPFTGDISIVRIYNRTLTSAEIMKNFVDQHNTLSIKYKLSAGDLKIRLDRVYPSNILNIIDIAGETTRVFQMGATGGTPPYKWSFNGGAFSTDLEYVVSNSVTSYRVNVKDAIGLTGSNGYYVVNSSAGKTYINGTFSYY